VAKADLGTKRLCPNCGAKYYDLNRHPIICPRCGTPFEVPTGRGGRPSPAAAVAAKIVEEEVEVAPEADVEVISLEQAADEEAAVADEVEEGDEAEVAAGEEEDVFLEEEEGEGDDVTNIIGDVDEEER
jgi:uncharacterized protein (TIGR02300 family)